MKNWIILDRDGTLIKEKNYLHDPDEAELLPGAGPGLRLLALSGYRFAVVTNQSGIGRGYYSEDDMRSVHRRIDEMLAEYGVYIEGWFHCPHRPDEKCGCRKPGTGLVRLAEERLGFEAEDIAFVIGDKESDMELAMALQAPSVLLMTGYGAEEYARGARGSLNCAGMYEAAERIASMENEDFGKIFSCNVEKHVEAARAMDAVAPDVCAAACAVVSAFRSGGRLLLCGNGGSAADAQHIAAELSGRYLKERRALDASALSCNTSAVTAVGNDYGYEEIFARQVEAHGKSGDVLIAISTSGKSANVLKAVEHAKSMGLYTIAMTGAEGGPLASAADAAIRVPSSSTPRIQELHILAGHALCEMVERALFS